jgi:hypothetical protein
MARERIQFVDSISASAAVRLTLSSAPWSVLANGTDISPPPLTRAINSTLLQDGAAIPAAAYENRMIKLHLQLDHNDPVTAASMVQMLHWELNRPRNILRWQPEPSIPAVYFRTFRAPDYEAVIDYGINLYDFQVSLIAEPFSYGLREDFGPVVVSSDVASGSNGRYFDLTGVKGDVETPLQLRFSGADVTTRQTAFAVRRGGTPSQMPLFLQVESMTQGTDTATLASGTAYSGSGNNTSATSFATTTTLAQRLSTTLFPSSASVDVRGQYRVYLRGLPSGVHSPFATVSVELRHGVRATRNKAVTLQRTGSLNPIPMTDLGLIQIPEGMDPVTSGPDGAPISVAGIPLSIWMSRSSAAGGFTADNIVLMPTDDRSCIVNWSSSSPTTFVMDGTTRSIYGLDGSGNITDILSCSVIGDFPFVSPNVTNRIVTLRDVSPDLGSTADLPTHTLTINGSYWPRYLTVRPLTT